MTIRRNNALAPAPTRSEKAMRKALDGRRTLARAKTRSGFDRRVAELDGEAELAEATAMVQPPANVLRASREVTPAYKQGEAVTAERQKMLDTLAEPSVIAVEASEQRMTEAIHAGVLPMAMDAAESARCANSLETMVSHQAATAHVAAMRLATMAMGESPLNPIERARLANAAARLMEATQGALLALNKVRSGGRQTVLVQYVQVTDNSKAVIAGELHQGSQGG